jgi:two-component system, response regulator YesN
LKLLICDDEKPALEMMKALIDWKDLGITEIFTAKNGLEAKKVVEKEIPDIIITDIVMPFEDGLILSKWVKDKYPEITIIIMSAFNEFEYAQQAMRYGVKGYLLKPIDEEKLELLALEAINEITTKKGKEERISATRNIAAERLLRQLLFPRQNLAEYRNLLNTLEIKVDFSSFRLLLVTITQHNYNDYISTTTEETARENIKILKKLWHRASRNEKDYIFENIPGAYLVLMTDIDENGDIAEALTEFRDKIKKEIGSSFVIAVSKFYNNLYSLPKAYNEVQKYTEKRYLHETKKILIPTLFEEITADYFDSSDKEKSGYIKKAKEYISAHYSENINLDDICDYAAISKNYFCHLFKNETKMSIWEYLTNFRIERAKDFLIASDMKNYEVSFRIGYENPSYFSKTFKKITGKSPSEFRNQIKDLT